jgi:hypothetical protein
VVVPILVHHLKQVNPDHEEVENDFEDEVPKSTKEISPPLKV